MAALLVMSTSVNSQTINIENPRFYDEGPGPYLSQILNVSFGWFKTLDHDQKEAYYSSMIVALEEAQPGQTARWYRNNASGTVRVAWQEPRNGSVCKRLHISIIAHDTLKNMQTTACFNETDNNWLWYR
jgi:surface antigen